MKILYLSDPEPDYGSTQLYMGLCQYLGDENVIDFPYKCCLHDKVERLENADIAAFMKNNPNVSIHGNNSIPYSWIVPSKGVEYNYNQIVDMIKSGIFSMILLPPRPISRYYLKCLINDCRYNMPPVTLCDFEDSCAIRLDIWSEFNPYIKMVTKSCYHPDHLGNIQKMGNNRIIRSLQLASPIVDSPMFRFDDSNESKTIDVSARLGLTRHLRKNVVESLQKLDKLHHKSVVAILSVYSPTYGEYLHEIAQSKISISMGGHANYIDGRGMVGVANRTWEIPSYNTLMLCESIYTRYEHPFEDGKTCVFFDPNIEDDVYHKALYWLGDDMENERRKIAKAGNELLKAHHTCKARAIQLLDIAKDERLI